MSERKGRLDGKVAVVTGAASGIGEATAKLFAAEGASVLLCDLRLDAAKEVVAAIVAAGGRAEAVALDVADDESWRALFDKVVVQYGKLDVLVNNAGRTKSKPIHEMTLKEWRSVTAVNLDGVFLGTKYAVNLMSEAGGGSIINVASVSGMTPSAGASNYCASKAAVRMFSKTAAIECADADAGVRVNLVTPGGVKTPMWEKEPFFQALTAEHGGAEQAFAAMAGEAPSHQFFSADEVARTILYFASDDSVHLTGAEIVLDRGHTG